MNGQDMMAGLNLHPVKSKRHRHTPPGILVLNETWSAAAMCCEPGCDWLKTHRTTSGSDLGIAAKCHAETLAIKP